MGLVGQHVSSVVIDGAHAIGCGLSLNACVSRPHLSHCSGRLCGVVPAGPGPHQGGFTAFRLESGQPHTRHGSIACLHQQRGVQVQQLPALQPALLTVACLATLAPQQEQQISVDNAVLNLYVQMLPSSYSGLLQCDVHAAFLCGLR
jgi:hypothetical protein